MNRKLERRRRAETPKPAEPAKSAPVGPLRDIGEKPHDDDERRLPRAAAQAKPSVLKE